GSRMARDRTSRHRPAPIHQRSPAGASRSPRLEQRWSSAFARARKSAGLSCPCPHRPHHLVESLVATQRRVQSQSALRRVLRLLPARGWLTGSVVCFTGSSRSGRTCLLKTVRERRTVTGNSELGAVLRDLRKSRHLTLAAVARHAGCAEALVSYV